MKCLVCGKILDSFCQYERMFYSGVVGSVVAGYGSQFDSMELTFGLCDICIRQKMEDGLLLGDDCVFR